MKLRKPPPWEVHPGTPWQRPCHAGKNARKAVDARTSTGHPIEPLSARHEGGAPLLPRCAQLPRIDLTAMPGWSPPDGMSEPAATLFREAVKEALQVSSNGVRLAIERAREVVAGVAQDIADARIHVDKFLALSHRILHGESRKAAEARRAGTPAQAKAMFHDRMAQIAANRQEKLISALCKGLAEDPACEPTLLALGRHWGLDDVRLRREFAARVEGRGDLAGGDGRPSNGPST